MLEHLDYAKELPMVLEEMFRILKPAGLLRISVPDFEILCHMFLDKNLNAQERFHIMRIVFGGQTDPFDYHQVGLTWRFLNDYLKTAGFSKIKRVKEFGMFEDCSSLQLFGNNLISLNVESIK